MAYLNLDLDYFEHPKTRRLIGLLGKGSEVVPLRLWAYVGKYHAVDGKLAGYSAQEIESVLGWWGESGALLAAMLKVGFVHCLPDGEEGYEVHDWLEHQGHIIAFKEKARSMAQNRWEKAKTDAASNAASITRSNAASNAIALPTIPTIPTIKEKPWFSFIEMRKKKRAMPTARAIELICCELEKIYNEHGHDPNEVLDQSTKNNWTDVYPLKAKKGAPKKDGKFTDLDSKNYHDGKF